jgi:acyl transferase domain-containing protein
VDELAIANQDTVQVVIGSPLKSTPKVLSRELKNFRIRRRLTLAANPFLQDHVISGRPVLPTTCALTWITHGCEQLYPGYQVFACRNYKILKGIIFDENLAPEYILDLQEIAKNGSDEIEFDAKIWSRNIEGKIRYHFSGQVILQREIQDTPRYELLDLKQQPELITTKSLYQNGENSLFHGPTFHGVKSILNASVDKLTIECYVPQPEPRQQGQFPVQTFNPYTADVQSHALWIWSQHFHQEGCLPSEFSTFEQFTKLPFDQTFYVSCEIKSRTDLAVVADMITHDSQGQVYSRILGAKATILPKLGN